MPQRLARRHPVVWVVHEQLVDEVYALHAAVRDELLDAATLLGGEVEVHVLRPLLHLRQQVRRWRADDVVDLLDLVQLIGARKQWEQADDLEKHAPHTPHIHLIVVVAVRQQALGRAVPPRGDVLRVGLLAVDAAATPKVCQLQAVVHDEDVLGLDVAVEDPVAMHMVHGLYQLVHVGLHAVLRDVVAAPANQLVDVHIHELEHQRQAPRGLVVQHLQQLDDVGVWGQPPQRLDLAQVVHLVQGVEVILHALDGDVLAVLDALRLQHLTERAFALLGHQAVLVHPG
mmetsp:Transcript_28098/g.69182  ORF Transcript_28098/g.69182 Transcript_28098/m.69182 type:complete len:286 (-) Transcript_28098:170-1027(-)